ncbi:MAG: hypothetical protein, partial [Olavius algarvensis Gamma 3 endosymbiont]
WASFRFCWTLRNRDVVVRIRRARLQGCIYAVPAKAKRWPRRRRDIMHIAS